MLLEIIYKYTSYRTRPLVQEAEVMDKLMKKLKSLEPEEREQIKQMLSEKKKTDDENLGWMYREGKPESEEYLLGRRIDKFIDNEKEEKVEAEKQAPGALFSEVMARRADLDMQTKMREDPLYAIRKKEEEARRKLLANPIKMKQLQKALDKKNEEVKKNKKKKKKDKKHKRRKRESDESESDSDDDIIQKYLAILGKKKTESRLREEGGTEDSDEDEGAKRGKKNYGLLVKGAGHGSGKKRSKSRSSSPRSRSRSPRSRSKSPRSRSRSPRRQWSRKESKMDSMTSRHGRGSRSPRRRRSLSPRRRRSPSPGRPRESRRHRSRSPGRERNKKYSREPAKKKMDEETMRRMREEMMSDAKWRNEQRESNIDKYKKQDQKEREKTEKDAGKEASFLKPIMSEHAAQSSVEDRLKRNRYNIQRTKVAIDKNFTKQ